jgi:broad specificity phosphatase PhoE
MMDTVKKDFVAFDVGSTVVNYGKYNGMTYGEICEKDEGYLYCLSKKGWFDSPPGDKWHDRNAHVKAWIKKNIYQNIFYKDDDADVRGDARGQN